MKPDALLRAAARCWERAGHNIRAAERYAQAKAWSGAGRCWSQAGRVVDAAEAYARAGEPIPEARQWLQSSWPERARRVYQRALESDLNASWELEARLGLGEIEGALASISSDADSVDALSSLARLASARGRPDLAARAFAKAVALRPALAGEVFEEWEGTSAWNRSLGWGRPARRSRERPSWASDLGKDAWGVYAEFSVGGVTHRLRWIAPGEFVMGSPETEEGRDDDEVQHEVTLTRGFWLGETACTQALWEAVMGENPSDFRSLDRPVEQVSWEDCQRFIVALNARVPGLEARLPSEAEWEYACRAGTSTSTYAGELEILGDNNAPLLDSIAWYGGNSGRDFDLDTGHDISWFPDKQYPDAKGGTRLVGQKSPNAWGLYDMLGNVWEWCSDWYGPYDASAVVDPQGPTEGTRRVYRGGSWHVPARSVRAAYRSWRPPGARDHVLGFRVSRGQGRQGKDE